MKRSRLLVWLLTAAAGGVTANDEVADRATRRLPPSAFAQLPSDVRIDAEQRGCSVPQSSYDDDRGEHNVINGQFRDRGVPAWAVLCSRERVSAILVCNGGHPWDARSLRSLQIVSGCRPWVAISSSSHAF